MKSVTCLIWCSLIVLAADQIDPRDHSWLQQVISHRMRGTQPGAELKYREVKNCTWTNQYVCDSTYSLPTNAFLPKNSCWLQDCNNCIVTTETFAYYNFTHCN